MIINWYGQGCFRIQTGGVSLMVDPPLKSSGAFAPRFKYDILIRTLVGQPLAYEPEAHFVAITGPGEYEAKGVEIKGLMLASEKESVRTVYLINAEGLKLGLLGPIKKFPNPEIIEALGDLEVVFMPAGGAPFIDHKEAVKLVKQLNPRLLVASFFKIAGDKQSGDIKGFLKELEQNPEPAESLVVKKKDLPEKTKLVVLKA